MSFQFTQITYIWEHHFKLFRRLKSTQEEKVRFIKENKLQLTQGELLSFF